MSFNNSRNSETKQRFTIKKFKIGTASVLIGTVFAVNGAVTVVSADETTTPAVAEQTDIKQVEESAANVSNSDDQALGSDSLTSTEDTAKEASELTAASETDNKEENVQLTESDTEKENTSNLDNQTTDLADDENAVEVQDSKEQTDEEANSNDTVLGTETLDGSDDSLGDEDSTETREVKTYPKASELPTLTRAEAESLNKEIIWLDFSDSKAEITGIENVANGSTVRPAIRAGATYKREIAPGYIIYVEFLNTLNINGVESSQDVIFDIQSERWSHLSQAGMKTGNKYTNITTFNNNANIGITLRVTATYNDKPVSPTVIVADGEEAGATEYIMFKTDGTPWDLLANVKNNLSAPNYTVNNSSTNPLFINENTENGGLGTQVFGPITNKLSISSTPIVSTAAIDPISGVTLSVYMDTTGKQSFQIGFVTRDTGDAPESYGGASHKMADADNPYLGTVPPDMDEGTLTPWTGDDNTLDADEGITQLTGLSENDSKLKVSAEGETFVLPVITNLSGTSAAYVHAWIDFNNNGKFDNGELIDGESGPEEGSAIVNAIDGTIELVFPTTAALESYKGIDKLGVRVRIAKNQSQIESPTGAAESGEVEDFQLNIKKGNVKVNFYLVGTTTEVSPSVYAVEEGLVGKRYSTLEARQNVEDSAKDHAAEKFVIYDADGKVYERVNVVGAEEGKITNSLTEVTYYYKLAQKDVIARFVTENEDGSYTTIEDSVLVKENEEVGVDYDASSRAKNEIVTSDGKTYTLREDRPENEKGKVKVENVVVTYIYDEVKADVTVNYVDESGNEIKSPVTVK